MDCRVCDKNDSRRRFFCSSCVTTRLVEHYTRRKHLINVLDLATSKATDLLTPPPASNLLGVQDERLLKAEQWKLACKVRDTRLIVEKGKESLAADQIILNERRIALDKRRNNLINARALLLPVSTEPSLSTSQITLARNHHSVLLQTEETRQILLRELLAVYGFTQVERILPSPFKSSSSDSSSISSMTALDSNSPVYSHTLATLPLPSLLSITSTPAILLSATLNNLLHLIRLIALYLNISLPFLPLPTLYGPGRPGVKAKPDIGDLTYPLFTSPSSNSSTSSKSKSKSSSKNMKQPSQSNSTSNSHSNSNSSSLLTSTIIALTPTNLISTPQSGGIEDEIKNRELERRESRSKAVLGGATALAFNLAYMGWSRGEEFSDSLAPDEGGGGGGGEEFMDLGVLVGRLMRTFSNGGNIPRGGINRNRVTPTTLPPQRNSSENFPIEFNSLLAHFTEPSITTAADVKKSRKGSKFDKDGEGSTDEGWDLV